MLPIPKTIRFENFAIDSLIDGKGRYLLKLEPAFPLSIKPISFQYEPGRLRLNWHERLEIFVAVQGEGDFHMGSQAVRFRAGDILIVDTMKHHGLGKIYTRRCRALSISFLPELVYNPASPASAFALLLPFYSHAAGVLLVRNTDRAAEAMHRAIAPLLNSYFSEPQDRLGCYVFLLEFLYLLSQHFSGAATGYAEYRTQQRRIRRLARLLEYIQSNYAGHIPVERGAAMTAMSVSRFMRFFKTTTGMTFVAYLTHVRVNIAADLLRSSERSIGEIAAATGFPDQSYFGRVFRKQFGMAPARFRLHALHQAQADAAEKSESSPKSR
jgi:AraC-like DNA-binding protein